MNIVLTEKQQQVRWVTINRPERKNALDRDTIYALKEALNEATSENDTRVVVLTGTGGAFSSGADLRADPARVRHPLGKISLKTALTPLFGRFGTCQNR